MLSHMKLACVLCASLSLACSSNALAAVLVCSYTRFMQDKNTMSNLPLPNLQPKDFTNTVAKKIKAFLNVTPTTSTMTHTSPYYYNAGLDASPRLTTPEGQKVSDCMAKDLSNETVSIYLSTTLLIMRPSTTINMMNFPTPASTSPPCSHSPLPMPAALDRIPPHPIPPRPPYPGSKHFDGLWTAKL